MSFQPLRSYFLFLGTRLRRQNLNLAPTQYRQQRRLDKSRYFVIIQLKIVLSFCHGVCFSMNIFGKCGKCIFTLSDRKKKKSEVSFTHEQNIICSLTQLDAIVHERTIICGQLFVLHRVINKILAKGKNLNIQYASFHE